MRILVTNPRSPKFTINLDKTPIVLGGKKEHFGSITDMIGRGEGRRLWKGGGGERD